MLVPKPIGGAIRGALGALFDRYTPLQAQVVATRRCNLTCGYCNEYDDFSPPVPYETLCEYIDHLAHLGTVVLTWELPSFYEEIRSVSRKSLFHRFGEGWEREMLEKGVSPWKCRAGARYLYVDEFGEVSYCSQMRGDPGIALLDYSREDLIREWHLPKGCEDRCTIWCVRRASAIDEWRSQDGTPNGTPKRRGGKLLQLSIDKN